MDERLAILRPFNSISAILGWWVGANGRLSGTSFTISSKICSKMGNFFESGKDKTAEREGRALPFICCAQYTVGQ